MKSRAATLDAAPRCADCSELATACKTCRARESRRQWKLRNPEKVSAAKAKWKADNPDYMREYYQANRVDLSAKSVAYKRAHPEQRREISARYAKKHAAEIERRRKERLLDPVKKARARASARAAHAKYYRPREPKCVDCGAAIARPALKCESCKSLRRVSHALSRKQGRQGVIRANNPAAVFPKQRIVDDLHRQVEKLSNGKGAVREVARRVGSGRHLVYCGVHDRTWSAWGQEIFKGRWCRDCRKDAAKADVPQSVRDGLAERCALRGVDLLRVSAPLKRAPKVKGWNDFNCDLKCRSCAREWNVKLISLRNRQPGCRLCSLQATQAHARNTGMLPRIVAACEKKGLLYLGGPLSLKQRKIEVQCLTHDERSSINISDLTQKAGSSGRPWCCKKARLRVAFRRPYAETKALVEEFGWMLVTDEASYTNSSDIDVECKNGHRSNRTIQKVVSGETCGKCVFYRSQYMVRHVLRWMFPGASFNTEKPTFLISRRGGRMEFDCYEPSVTVSTQDGIATIALAVEVQGPQHYGKPLFGNENMQTELVMENDEDKRRISAEHGIVHIEIPDAHYARREFGTPITNATVIESVRRALASADVFPINENIDRCDPLGVTRYWQFLLRGEEPPQLTLFLPPAA